MLQSLVTRLVSAIRRYEKPCISAAGAASPTAAATAAPPPASDLLRRGCALEHYVTGLPPNAVTVRRARQHLMHLYGEAPTFEAVAGFGISPWLTRPLASVVPSSPPAPLHGIHGPSCPSLEAVQRLCAAVLDRLPSARVALACQGTRLCLVLLCHRSFWLRAGPIVCPVSVACCVSCGCVAVWLCG